jgi:AcrR family transcriptional regulator
MPKIAASTVAEHRARQRDLLVSAARDLLIGGGYPALTFSALAARTGLARPTIYTYFRSKDDLVVALCEAEFPLVAAEIQRAVERATTPRDQIAAFVRAQLRVAQQSRYRIVHALASAPLADEARQRIMALHRELVPSAVPLFVRAGHPRPALAAALLQGLINAAVTAIDAGEPPRRVIETTVQAALDGLAHDVGASPAADPAVAGEASARGVVRPTG